MGDRQSWESQFDGLSQGDSATAISAQSGDGDHCTRLQAVFQHQGQGQMLCLSQKCLVPPPAPAGNLAFTFFGGGGKSRNFSPPPSPWLGRKLCTLWLLELKPRRA